MNNRQNPLFWAFGAGTWAGVHLRISWFMPLLLAGVLYEFHMKLGAAFFGIIFVSVLLHEISHILAARATDGSGDEILMWPLGGLAFVEGSSPRTQVLTFWFNWVSLLVNLVPAYPLDGGQVFRSLLAARMGTGMGTEVALRCG